MKLFLSVVYGFLKYLLKTVFGFYFSKTTIVNKEYLNFDRAAIVVSNHPNTMMDPFNVCTRIKKQVFFLTNASLYYSKYGHWFFRNFFTIPIERQVDASGKRINNEKAFAACDKFLGNGGCLWIAPEGTSVMERKLRKLKSGTARIALSAESKKDFQLGLVIIPNGITYSDPSKFRSTVFIKVGKPIIVADYKEHYLKDKFKAAKALTADMEKQMQSLVLNTADDEEDAFVKNLETILQNEKTLDLAPAFERSKKLVTNIQNWKKTNHSDFKKWETKVHQYFQSLAQFNLIDRTVKMNPRKFPFAKKIIFVLIAVLLFPIYAFGYVNNFLANYIPWKIANSLSFIQKHPVYCSSVKSSLGLFTYPIFYGLQIFFVHRLFNNNILTITYIASVILTGFFIPWYEKLISIIKQRFLFDKLLKKNKNKIDHLCKNRKAIVAVLSTQIH